MKSNARITAGASVLLIAVAAVLVFISKREVTRSNSAGLLDESEVPMANVGDDTQGLTSAEQSLPTSRNHVATGIGKSSEPEGGLRIRGVVSSAGDEVADARVWAEDKEGVLLASALADSDGEFSFALPDIAPDPFVWISASSPVHQTSSIVLAWAKMKTHLSEVTFELSPGFSAYASVVDLHGGPIVDAAVHLQPSGKPSSKIGRTDIRGRIVIQFEEQYIGSLRAVHVGSGSGELAGLLIDRTLELPPIQIGGSSTAGGIGGRAISPGGNGLPGLRIALLPGSIQRDQIGSELSREQLRICETDQQGYFEITNFPFSEYWAVPLLGVACQDLATKRLATTNAPLELEIWEVIVHVGESGVDSIENADVLFNAGGIVKASTTDPDGIAHFFTCAPGRVELQVDARDAVNFSQILELELGRWIHEVVVDLTSEQNLGLLQLNVCERDGLDYSFYQLQVFRVGGQSPIESVWAHGLTSAPLSLPAGDYYINGVSGPLCRAPLLNETSGVFTVYPGVSKDVELCPALGSTFDILIAGSGGGGLKVRLSNAIDSQSVTCRKWREGGGATLTKTFDAGVKGEVAEVFKPGPYTLTVSRGAEVIATQEIRLQPGKNGLIILELP